MREFFDLYITQMRGVVEKTIESIEDLGSLIRYHRKQASLSQEELCLMAGISRTALQGIEQGRRGTQLDTLFKIFHVLNMHLRCVSALAEWEGTQS